MCFVSFFFEHVSRHAPFCPCAHSSFFWRGGYFQAAVATQSRTLCQKKRKKVPNGGHALGEGASLFFPHRSIFYALTALACRDLANGRARALARMGRITGFPTDATTKSAKIETAYSGRPQVELILFISIYFFCECGSECRRIWVRISGFLGPALGCTVFVLSPEAGVYAGSIPAGIGQAAVSQSFVECRLSGSPNPTDRNQQTLALSTEPNGGQGRKARQARVTLFYWPAVFSGMACALKKRENKERARTGSPRQERGDSNGERRAYLWLPSCFFLNPLERARAAIRLCPTLLPLPYTEKTDLVNSMLPACLFVFKKTVGSEQQRALLLW